MDIGVIAGAVMFVATIWLVVWIFWNQK